MPRFIELRRQGRFPTDNLVSHRIGLDDIIVALDRIADGGALRQVIEFWQAAWPARCSGARGRTVLRQGNGTSRRSRTAQDNCSRVSVA